MKPQREVRKVRETRERRKGEDRWGGEERGEERRWERRRRGERGREGKEEERTGGKQVVALSVGKTDKMTLSSLPTPSATGSGEQCPSPTTIRLAFSIPGRKGVGGGGGTQ